MRKTIMLICLLLLFSGTVSPAPVANSDNSDFYYRIGGARSISLPPNINVSSRTLDASFEFGMGYSCGKFDPVLGLSNILNELQGLGNDLINGAIGAVTAAIGSLPALILQRVDPGLYDLYQNALIRAEATLALANKTCEQYEQEIRKGQNPYDEWTELAKVIDWKVQMGEGGYGSSDTDVVQAKRTVETNNGANGTPWIGGQKAGGDGQEAIRITHDVVMAGYNLTLNRAANDTSAAGGGGAGAEPPRLVEIWPNPEAASQWATDVLGDKYIRTYDNHSDQSVPGFGLLPKIAKKTEENQDILGQLVAGSMPATVENLEMVSSNAALINNEIIDAIHTLKPSEQSIAVSKLASEAAMSSILEKALMTRRLLLTGSREPNITASPADKHIEQTVAQLDQDIENILFERRIHQELTTQTPKLILQLQNARKNQAGPLQQASGSDEKIVEEGGASE